MIYLHKILPLLLMPLAWVSYLIVAGILTRRKTPLVLALTLLWASSIPYLSNVLVQWTEHHAMRRSLENLPPADYVVILSGMIHVVAKENNQQPSLPLAQVEWSDPDRFFSGVELFQAQAKQHSIKLILTAGLTPWWPQSPSEGNYLAEMAQRLGVPKANILITANVQDTAQEAREVKKVIEADRPHDPPAKLLLVTSAFHMPRASQVFEDEGLQVTAYPVDFKTKLQETTVMDFIPDAESLKLTQLCWRELLGRALYGLRPLGHWLN